MTRFFVRTAALSIAIVTLAVFTAAAKDDEIEEGVDYWRTPDGGSTFTFPAGDVEHLCHKAADSTWDHKISLKGVPAKGSDWDSAVSRITDAEFHHGSNTATTRVHFKSLSLTSSTPSATPCGSLDWTARLAKGLQPITKMTIMRDADKKGGLFHADLKLRVEFRATKSGTRVGSLFYDVKLGDPTAGTAWSYGDKHRFRAGMGPDNSCLKVLRDKLGNYPPGSQHFYFISNLIAQGKCSEKN